MVYNAPPVEHVSKINSIENPIRNVKTLIQPNQNTIRLVPRSSCNDRKEKLVVLIVVTSEIENSERRTAIRETWGKDRFPSDLKYQLTFLIGMSSNDTLQKLVETEHRIFGDILQESFTDTKSNLTLKSIFMLKFFSRFCSLKVQYLMKVQDNVYINVFALHELIRKNKKTNYLTGTLNCGVWSKYGYPNPLSHALNTFNDFIFPNFLSGTSYLMSKATAYKLYKMSLMVPIFHLENVFVTGILPDAYNKLVKDEDKNVMKSLLKNHGSTLSDIKIHPENDFRFDQSFNIVDQCFLTSIISSVTISNNNY